MNSWFHKTKEEEIPWTWPEDEKESISGSNAPVAQSYIATTFGNAYYDGENFWGGITGKIDEIASLDYWTLRARSGALFRTNSYAQGIVRRLVTNVIHKGLCPEFEPEESVLGMQEDELVDWADERENQYRLYCQAKNIIDCKGYRIDGELQQQIYEESFIDGDALVVCRQHSPSGLPQIQIVSGNRVQTPSEKSMDESVVDGVHLDKNGRHLGFWVYQGTEYVYNDTYTYIPAYGPQSGRHTAWLVYGPLKREDDVRGMPGLGVAIQPLNEILKYRDSAQRKAEIGARITAFIKRTQATQGQSSLRKSATRKDTLIADPSGETAPLQVDRYIPGTVLTRLNAGDEPVVFQSSTEINFPAFEAAIIAGLAWSFEIPPECLVLSYNSNFSASQAAIRELNMFLEKERDRFASQHCQNLLEEWFVASVLLGKIQATGFLEAWSDPKKYDVKRAWLNADWIGSIKPSLKLNDEVLANENMVKNAWQTNARSARGLTGTSFDRNVRRLAKENRMKAEAMRPLLELQKEYGAKNVTEAMGMLRVVDDPMREIKQDLGAI
jgi:capsid protein